MDAEGQEEGVGSLSRRGGR